MFCVESPVKILQNSKKKTGTAEKKAVVSTCMVMYNNLINQAVLWEVEK